MRSGTVEPDSLSITFGALADPTRRAILARLAGGEATVNELAKPFAVSVQAISKHLKVLEVAGLITRGKEAQFRPCRFESAPLDGAIEWIERHRQVWKERFDQLEQHLKEIQKAGPNATKRAEPRAMATTKQPRQEEKKR